MPALYRDAMSFGWALDAEPEPEVTVDGDVYIHVMTERLIKPMYPPLLSRNRAFVYLSRRTGQRLIVIEGL